MSARAAALVPALAQGLAGAAARLRESLVEIRHAPRGAGSGVVWDASGLVLTNAHVATAPVLDLVTASGAHRTARLLARDPVRDLAALVAEDLALPAVTPGDERALRPGALVMAVGHPFGVTGSVACGVVHAVGPVRTGVPMPAAQRGLRWVQADVPLAPGNSGGPLADAAGGLVGLNTMIVAGLALAVPVSEVHAWLAAQGLVATARR